MRKDLYLDIDLTLEPRYTKEFIVKRQDSVNLFITLKNENIPVIVEGQIPRLYVRKQDGTVVVQGGTEELGDGSIVLSENTAIIKLKNNAINTVGLCYAELELEDAQGTTITQNFLFEVVDRLADTDTPIKAVNDIYLLGEVEKFIIQAKKDLEEIRTSITVLQGNMNSAIADFNKKVEETVNKIATSETNALQNIETKRVESISSIDTKTQDSLSEIEASKTGAMQEVSGTKDSLLNEMATAKTQHIAELDDKTLKSMQELQIVGNTKINEMDAEHTAFKQTVSNAEVIKTALTELNALAELTKNDLNGANNTGQGIITELNKVIDSANNIKTLIEAENTEANANILELKPLNLEADLNIEELKALIKEAKEIAIPALKAYIKEHKPAEDLTEVNAQLEELYGLVNTLDAKFSNYYTKEEVDTLLGDINVDLSDYYTKEEVEKKVGFIDKLGTGLYREPEPVEFLSAPTPDFTPLHTIKIKSGSNYQIIYFKIPMVNSNKFMTTSTGTITGNLMFSGITITDYACYRYTSGSWTLNQTVLTTNPATKTTRIYYHDFPIYDNTGINILFDDTTKSGISNFNNATTEGKYSIDLVEEDFNNLYNGVKVEGGKRVVGVLDVRKAGTNVIQILDLASHGLTYMRTIGGSWIDTSNGAISKSAIGKVKVSGEGLPEFLKDIPPLPLYGQETKDLLIFKATSTMYYVYRFLDGWSGKNYYAGSTSFYIGASKAKAYVMTYNSSTNTWNTDDTLTSTSSVGSISVTKAEFKIYHNTTPVYTTSAGTVVYQDITIPNDGESTLLDVNDATNTGIYEIDAKIGDRILNLPVDTTQMTDEITLETYYVLAEDMKGLLEVKKLGNDVYQEITVSNGSKYRRVLSGGVWTNWETIYLVEYGEHTIEASVVLFNDETMTVQETLSSSNVRAGIMKDNDKYYVRISPKKKFKKVTGVTVSSDLADLIIGFELNVNTVLINGSNDFFIFIKNNFVDPGGYDAYVGLTKLIGRNLKYTIIGY